MTIQVPNFYDLSKFPNSEYLIMMEIEKFFGFNLFRGDLSRVQYSSEDYTFRKRLETLAKSGQSSVKELDMPFMSYWQTKSWEPDKRMGFQGAQSAMVGVTEEGIGGTLVRWMNMSCEFSCVAFFPSDAQARLAYSNMMFVNKPAPQQWIAQGLEYKGYSIDIPIYMNMLSLELNPGGVENQWLVSNKVYPVKFTIQMNSTILSQQAQSAYDTVFGTDEPPVITNKVILDFLSYKGANMFWDTTHPMYEIDRIFDPSIPPAVTFVSGTVTTNSIQLNWDWDSLATSELQPDIQLVLNGGADTKTMSRDLKTYTWTGLQPGSTYSFVLWVFGTDNSVIKKTLSVTTAGSGQAIGLKGMVGL